MEHTYTESANQYAFLNQLILAIGEVEGILEDEENVNLLLDSINEIKKLLREKTKTIQNINECIAKLAWHHRLNEDYPQSIKGAIASTEQLYPSLLRNYTYLSSVVKKEIAGTELKAFKDSIDRLAFHCEDCKISYLFYSGFQMR
jgi:hypothetical protein